MQQLLTRAALLCLLTGPALADASISTLQSATVPLPANSCIPASQGPGTDAVICSGYAAALGLTTSTLARTNSKPSNPTGTAATTPGVMMGLAGTITPTATGNVLVTIMGVALNSTSADGANMQIRYGTGSAPTNALNASGVATLSSIATTTFTVGTVTSGGFSVGQTLTGTNVAAGTVITANISGSGTGSTWTVSPSQTVASTTITGSMGTTCGNTISATITGATATQPYAVQCYAAGLTINTAYWIDVSLFAITGGTASLQSNEIISVEY